VGALRAKSCEGSGQIGCAGAKATVDALAVAGASAVEAQDWMPGL